MNSIPWRLALLAVFLPLFCFSQTPRKSDRDGDGIKNRRDRCPDVAGPAALFGCPDSDGDGLIDLSDLCPDQPGLEYLQGCPDRDDDGVSDLFDQCPDTPGREDRKGCPDGDDDGVVDDLDLCPDQPGSDKAFGCPDRDDDGVADTNDECPDLAGHKSGKGCPDSDGDGIRDTDDKCVNTPGLASLRGCPQVQPEDADLLKRSRDVAFFRQGTAELTPEGQNYLDGLVGLFARYPDFTLRIGVHTHTGGNPADNLSLTAGQALACRKYLVSKGILSARIQSKGYGDIMPIANNLYPEGRIRNKRVEMELILD